MVEGRLTGFPIYVGNVVCFPGTMGALDWLDTDYQELIHAACSDTELVNILMDREASYELALVAQMSKDAAVLLLVSGWNDPDVMNAVADNHSAPEEALRLVYETAVHYWGNPVAAHYVLAPLRTNPNCPADLAARIDQETVR